ncbi:MAG TPA: Uma2 family endonuclease [Thermoanaerobaculia bacterium]|jgi:Uma2 family endonuclease|nr:Uma2 family endonuclease [Thermoanaerobaculia bacterium]
MASIDARLKLTYDDLELLPNDGKRHEIIDGEHFVTPSQTPRHQDVAGRIYFHISVYLRQHPLGWVYLAPVDVVLSPIDVVVPDLLFISNERRSILTAENVQGAPDLVIEVLSDGTRRTDEVLKRKLYERFGVVEYWVADPEVDRSRIYRSEDDIFGRAVELSAEAGDSLTTPLLPGLAVPLAEIFPPLNP